MTVDVDDVERRGTAWASTWVYVMTTAFVVAVIAALVWRPLAGVVLAAGGAVFILFRLIDLDATTVLTIYLLLLTLVPATYVVPAFGGAGTPAGIFAVGVGYWWVLERTASSPRVRSPGLPHPVRPFNVAVAIYSLTALLAFVAAFARPLTSVEQNGAARALLSVVGAVGVALLASDGLRSWERFNVLLNRILNLGALMAVVACMQFLSDFDPVSAWRVPGLVSNRELVSVGARSVVNRVASTALHPIEFGAVLAVLLPLAIHSAIHAGRRLRTARWVRVGLLGLALPMSVSRTAIVIAVVALLMMWPAWTWTRRIYFAFASVLFLLVVRAFVSGLLGTVLSLFTSINDDPSTSGRTEDYGAVGELFAERPVFGRGLGTFDPGQYFFLDNQVLMTLLTGGLVGMLGLVVLIATSATLARQVFWHGPDEESRHLGAALAASIVGAAVAFLTFDALSFPMFTGLLFLLMGMAGAAWRLEVGPSGRSYTNDRARRVVAPAPARPDGVGDDTGSR